MEFLPRAWEIPSGISAEINTRIFSRIFSCGPVKKLLGFPPWICKNSRKNLWWKFNRISRMIVPRALFLIKLLVVSLRIARRNTWTFSRAIPARSKFWSHLCRNCWENLRRYFWIIIRKKERSLREFLNKCLKESLNIWNNFWKSC